MYLNIITIPIDVYQFFGLPRRNFVSPRNDTGRERFNYSVIARSSACRTTKQSKKSNKKMIVMSMYNQFAIYLISKSDRMQKIEVCRVTL